MGSAKLTLKLLNNSTVHAALSARPLTETERLRNEVQRGQTRGKVKSSQDEIRVLRNIAVMLLTTHLKLAWGSCCTHGILVHSVKLIYTDPLITIMSPQRLRLILNKLLIHAHPLRSNAGRLFALFNWSLGGTLAPTALPDHNLVSLDYISLGLALKNK